MSVPAIAFAFALAAAPAASEETAPALDLKLQLSLSAIQSNNTLLLPVGLGASAVAEWDLVGFEAGANFNGGSVCDNACGGLWTLEAGPRFRFALHPSWIPYLSAKFQLYHRRDRPWIEAISPRVGFIHQRRWVGFFLEAGPVVVLGTREHIESFVGLGYRRVVPSFALGVRFF